MKSKKLAIVYGTRPEFLKVKTLIDATKDCVPIQILQHSLSVDSKYATEKVEIRLLSDDRISNIASNILIQLPLVFKKHGITHVLAQGDTATTFYALLTAFQMQLKTIHLEAGLRTNDLTSPFPEEGYRQMISRIANIHLCPSPNEVEYLAKENITKNVYVVGNTILDLVASYHIPIQTTKKVLVTIHRRENWGHYEDILDAIFTAAQNLDYHFLLVKHFNENLQSKMIAFFQSKNLPNVEICDPLDHEQCVALLSECAFVITDSGGIQEEANFLGKVSFVMRSSTERDAISPQNLVLVHPPHQLFSLIQSTFLNVKRGYEYGDGNATAKIADISLSKK